jgi:hypothetical protein
MIVVRRGWRDSAPPDRNAAALCTVAKRIIEGLQLVRKRPSLNASVATVHTR